MRTVKLKHLIGCGYFQEFTVPENRGIAHNPRPLGSRTLRTPPEGDQADRTTTERYDLTITSSTGLALCTGQESPQHIFMAPQ
jgi:hypothetical protein